MASNGKWSVITCNYMDQMTENALAVCTIFFGDILTFSNITPKKLVRVSMIILLTISMQVINQEIQQLQPHSHRLEHTGQGRRGLQFVIRRRPNRIFVFRFVLG